MTATADDRPRVDVDVTLADRTEAAGASESPERVEGNGTMAVVGTALCILSALLFALVAELTVIGGLQHGRDQQLGYAQFREQLAEGTAPTGQTDVDGKPLVPGAPVALLRIPALGLDEVVREGTTSGVLMSGPGHRRDTVLPGQAGTSVLMGRQAAYGGPFGALASLPVGTPFEVTTGQGTFTFRITGFRGPGAPQVAPPADTARLTFITADGVPYLASSTLRIDAELDGDPVERGTRVLGPGALSTAEQPMQGDPQAWIPLVFWAQGLVLASIGVVWFARRWGRWQTWVVGVPVLAVLGLGAAGQIARLLPNLL
jgi:sortase (surface protein transpeptidase)